MSKLSDTIKGLTTNAPTLAEKSELAQVFANELGWTPSYDLRPFSELNYVTTHLVVEHGLENSAVLSFLKKPYNNLLESERHQLLNISYNNLVDWHIHIDENKATYVYNRNSAPENVIQELTFRQDQYDSLRSDAFEKLIGKRQTPNIPTLDDSLINTISHWKRNISAELNNEVSNLELSALFNSIFFIRALEDNLIRYGTIKPSSRILLKSWEEYKGKKSYTGVIEKAKSLLGKSKIPSYLIDSDSLMRFDSLDKQTISYLLSDFYENKNSRLYSYDFSIMSNHALSRIYERYSALLKVQGTEQLKLFADLPVEEINKSYGAVYTPQYIARFFGRYLKQNLPPNTFNSIKVAEPSVGSGIFLRSLLEIKCDPRIEGNTIKKIKQSFKDILGIDVDPNACQATKLSLALLQLVLTNEFPDNLNIIEAETIEYIEQNRKILGTYDAVISNPPFIATDSLSEQLKFRITNYLGDHAQGRPDSYLAFVKAGIELLKPGGFGMYVLPHSFLISHNASKVRKYLTDECWVRCLADLSAIPVFGNTGIYVILLIFQKKQTNDLSIPGSTIIKCREFVGKALQDGIRNKTTDNSYYSIYEIEQSYFNQEHWNVLPLKEIKLQRRLSSFPRLKEFIEVRQGFVTGADEIFILDKRSVPKGEEDIYLPYIPDKKIDKYQSPKATTKYVFYPFDGDTKLSENDIKRNYPNTWRYLQKNKSSLLSKKSFQNAKDWWRPLRTRQPEHILVPKLITPHLTIMPKFTIDSTGKYGVSRSPFLISKLETNSSEFLLYFLAVLNSTPCFWFISNHAHKYSHGYTMLEVKTLENTPVPNPKNVPMRIFKKLIELVQKRLKSDAYEGIAIEREIDDIVCSLYNLNSEEKNLLGIQV